MLILTEKPNVARDFSDALGCRENKAAKTWEKDGVTITNCIGHLYSLDEPDSYGQEFPIIPETFSYHPNEKAREQASTVNKLLKAHADDLIIIATDADREGEVIARECLMKAGIRDTRRIKRFWVSQALTKDVIASGMRDAKPLSEYNRLSEQGFARQKSDWLCGMNFSRLVSRAAKAKLSVGRVQTAILSAICKRCDEITNFKSEKYFEHYGLFKPSSDGQESLIKGIHFENESRTKFPDDSKKEELKALVGQKAILTDKKSEKKTENPPQLHNLNSLQKEAFKQYGYSAKKTLEIMQELYEELKCVSYPRTPSRVMGSENVELCRKIFESLCEPQEGMTHNKPASLELCKSALEKSDISLKNTRVFNDKKLEAHHAIIPLKRLPEKAGDEHKNIYNIIYNRFITAFLPPCEYEKETVILTVSGNNFRITGRKITKKGFKEFVLWEKDDKEEEESELPGDTDWGSMTLSDIETKEKWTKPPAYFNEASILSFMENPRNEKEDYQKKLVGLGTPATRHTFIPKLLKYGYIVTEKKNFIATPLGHALIKNLRNSPIESLADISATTDWEERMEENPEKFLSDIKRFVRESASKEMKLTVPMPTGTGINCPSCGKEIRKGKNGWFCSGYKEGCEFSVWETAFGTVITEKDLRDLCEGKETQTKKCKNKEGKAYECKLTLDGNKKLKPVYENKESGIKCPSCGKEMRKSKSGWYCSGYKEGCKVKIWSTVAEAEITEKDVAALCEGKKTGTKHCTGKNGKPFDCRFELDGEYKIKFVFEEKENGK